MKINPSSSHLRSCFSSGLRCVSLCLFRSGCPEMVESESEEAWLGIMTDIERLYPPCVEALCFPDIRRTLWAPPVPDVTTTMLYDFLDQDLCKDPFLYCLGVGENVQKKSSLFPVLTSPFDLLTLKKWQRSRSFSTVVVRCDWLPGPLTYLDVSISLGLNS